MIPAYPAFRPLDIGDKPAFDRLFIQDPPECSEFTFTNLYAWRAIYHFEISRLDGMVVLASRRHGEKEYFDPLGRGNRPAVVRQILDDTRSRFIRVSEKHKWDFESRPGLKIELDRDNADYLYLTEDLIQLRGNKYDGKRNLIKNFKSNYTYEYVALNAVNLDEILEFETVWCVEKNCDQVEGLDAERRTIQELVGHYGEFKWVGGAIRVKNEICAVAIGEKLNPETLVMHLLKAMPGMTGLYQTMNQEFMIHEGAAYRYANYEQDLGVEGLRRAKRSYHPVQLIDKYIISGFGF